MTPSVSDNLVVASGRIGIGQNVAVSDNGPGKREPRMGLRVRLKARRAGKWVTTLQLFTLVVLLVRPAWIVAAVAVVGAVSVVAVVDYTVAAFRSPHREDVPFQRG